MEAVAGLSTCSMNCIKSSNTPQCWEWLRAERGVLVAVLADISRKDGDKTMVLREKSTILQPLGYICTTSLNK